MCKKLLGLCVLLLLIFGCTQGGTSNPGGLPEPAVYLGCKVISETEIALEFSAPVMVDSLSFEPALEIDSIEDGTTVRVHLAKRFKQGISYLADILAVDAWGEVIAETVSFKTDAPELLFIGSRVESEKIVDFDFSTLIQMITVSFDPAIEIRSIEKGSTVRVSLNEDLKPGQRIETVILAEDEFGQTIDVTIPLQAGNNRIPKLLINELRTEYSGSASRAEFIEFKILTDGNLGGLQVFAASNANSPMIYEFKPVEIAAGEYVVLHLRTLEDGCIDEYGDRLDVSGGRDSSPIARDFWIPGSTKLLRKTDIVYIADQHERVLDAVIISENPDPQWGREHFSQTAKMLFSQGIWRSSSGKAATPADAVSSANIKTSLTRSISRDETVINSGTATDWYVTATSGITPGLLNSSARFE